MEVIGLVNSVITLLYLKRSYSDGSLSYCGLPVCKSQSCSFYIFISSMLVFVPQCPFPPLGNSDHAVLFLSIDFPSNSQRDALFHCIAYDYIFSCWFVIKTRVWQKSFFLNALSSIFWCTPSVLDNLIRSTPVIYYSYWFFYVTTISYDFRRCALDCVFKTDISKL